MTTKQGGFSLAIVLIFVLALSLIATGAVQMTQVETLASTRAAQRMHAKTKAIWAVANAERTLQGLSTLVWNGHAPAPEATSKRLPASDLGLDETDASAIQVYRIQTHAQVENTHIRVEALFSLVPSAQRLSLRVLE